MRSSWALLLTAVLLAGCAGGGDGDTRPTPTTVTNIQQGGGQEAPNPFGRTTPTNATPSPTPSPTPEPTPSPTPSPTPEPTPDATPSPTPDPTPDATPEPTPEPGADATEAVTIMGFAFQPANLEVAAGTTVVWTNADSATHTVTSDAGHFDSGNLPEGATYEHAFVEPGTYAYHCALHPSMTGRVVVA